MNFNTEGKRKINLVVTEKQLFMIVQAITIVNATATDPFQFYGKLRQTARDLLRTQLLIHLSDAFEKGNWAMASSKKRAGKKRKVKTTEDNVLDFYERQMD